MINLQELGYPIFISYPRTGSHWINCVSELYFDRPRLRQHRVTLMASNRTDFMWSHDHDHDCQQPPIAHKNTIYLYRDPVPTILSNLMYRNFEFIKESSCYSHTVFVKEAIQSEAFRYRMHLAKWLTNPDFKVKTILKYENFITDRLSEFKKMVDHFNNVWDPDRASSIFDRVTKQALIEAENTYQPALNPNLLSEAYANTKQAFARDWTEMIHNIVLTPELQDFFPSLRTIDKLDKGESISNSQELSHGS